MNEDADVNLAETSVIKAGNVFAVTRRDGSVPPDGPLGVYADDCRFLSRHELRVAGAQPRLLVASAQTGSAAVHELTNPALPELPLQRLRIRVERRLDGDGMEERILVRSFHRAPLDLDLTVRLAADFEPMLAIRGILELRGGEVAAEPVERGLRFSLEGRDGRTRSTTVTADRECEAAGGELRFALALAPGAEEAIALRYALGGREEPPAQARPPAAPTAVASDDALFDLVLERSLLDIRMLHSSFQGEAYYAAGVPWYATLFGRDALITAHQLLAYDAPMAAQTLRVLARLIGTREDPEHDEEPGKVLHELRVGEVARLGLSPLARYYGTVDATPLFLALLCEHANWTGDLVLFHELREPVEAMLGWIGDRLLVYERRAEAGLRNQGWKDSEDGVVDGDGIPLEPPIALIEPQAYAVRAKRGLAELFARDGDAARAARLRAEADALAERLERFWLAGRGFYAMAIDGSGSVSSALASNQGHLLWAGVLGDERAAAVRSAVMAGAMFSGWGIRTLGEGEGGYNPVGYHLGSVWPHDTALIAAGLRRHGFDGDFDRVFAGLLDAAAAASDRRLAELFAGYARVGSEPPVPYPVACQPQAWAAGAIPYLLACGLGLVAEGFERRLRVVRPSLPRQLDRLELRGLRVAGATADLRFERGPDGAVALADARVDGDLRVVTG